ncbi:MAG: DUF5698 domain-containing protein [Sphaerochaetaceae bacterium]|jgi:uncharacterized protein YebE (UPF0316 family)|nr:DUF5698 domain-containing protein [Sphaerochaetaceae bacterium]MDX9810464.1 DUF5698 domain-containing protein [Sphaerochaetaceae bacterium]NLV85310.1 hypothetical protein [Spirochaetales bacterium]
MEFLENTGIFIYFIIFFGKILEVTISTMRMVMINRGERAVGAVIAFFDILLWLFITGTVLVGFSDDPLRVVVFAVAFSVGNYLGSWLEAKLAFGIGSIQVIVSEGEESSCLVKNLREHNFAVTVLKGTGKDGIRDVLILHSKRKRIPAAIELIKSLSKTAVIVTTDAKVSGGYLPRK